jgi:hypothetical protein
MIVSEGFYCRPMESVPRWLKVDGLRLGSRADFSKLIAEKVEKWGKVVKFSGARPN